MGIDGLLKFLRPVTEKEHISSFKNQRAGIDIMSWIYRGCYNSNMELCQNIKSNKFLYYLLQMTEILSYYNIKPIFIFDGRSFGLKNQTNMKRNKQKQENKAKAMELLKEGKTEEARKYFSRCIFIDESIISTTMNVMHSKNIPFYVAPYEADCQIAKLKKIGVIDVAISEDSDLIAYGVNTILKLNQNGDCDYIDPSKWAPRDVDSRYLKEYFAMNEINRLQCAILAGTDYNNSIKGIGIMRAVRLMYRQGKMANVINKLRLQKNYKDKVPDHYQELVEKVKMIFLFATVYNPLTKELQHLNQDLITSLVPQQISRAELTEIVGQRYPEYIQKQVYIGKTIARDLLPRQIKAESVREIFAVNKQNMITHESMNKERREQLRKIKIKKDIQIQNGVISQQEMKPSLPKKLSISNSRIETEEDKQKRKLQRKNRIIKLQDVMNSVVQMCQNEDNEQKQPHQVHSMQFLHKKMNQVKTLLSKTTSQSHQQSSGSSSDQQIDSIEESEVQSESLNLAFLNPCAKIPQQQKTATKQKSK